MTETETLRSRLARKPIVVAPGVYDPFTALVATQAGFTTLMVAMSLIALIGACCVLGLPGEEQMRASRQEA